jgi:aminopeptidase N
MANKLCLMGAFHSQEVPVTPGQPLKEPMFIPVAVGLLDSTGKDIPLSSVYHDGTLQSVTSNDHPVYTTVLRVTKVSSEHFFSSSRISSCYLVA